MKLFALVFIVLQCCLSAEVLKPNTKIQLGVNGVPEAAAKRITGVYSIDGKGYIRLPDLPNLKVKASGISSAALERRIEDIYKTKKIYTSPVLVVTNLGKEKPDPGVLDAEVWVYIGGNVKKENKYKYIKDMTFADLLVEAGGIDTFGSKQRYTLTRNGKSVTWNYKKDLSKKSLKLKGGDHITIPKSSWRNP